MLYLNLWNNIFPFFFFKKKKKKKKKFIFDVEGVCDISPCSSRVPLEGHLCRIGPDDECFLYQTPGSEDSVCVPECPFGTEEEHAADEVSTGLERLEICLY
jgi:hypothetical protein